MSGIALTTISPSSTSSRRSTPCVEGCCGPIEMVICVSSGRSTTSNCGGMFTAVLIFSVAQTSVGVFLLPLPLGEGWGEDLSAHAPRPPLTPPKGRGINTLFQAVRFITAQRKILAQRMALPIIRQEYATQVRMTIEDNAKQIVCFALVPVRSTPHARYGWHVNIVFVQHNLQAQPMVLCGREQVVIDFEPRLFFRPAIKPTQVGQKVEFQLGRLL